MLKLGGACYSNTTTLTTGNWGEWKTEQSGVGASCNNASQNYFLEIKINNKTQGERSVLSNWDFLRKDTDALLNGSLTTLGGVNFDLLGTQNIVIDGSTNLRNMSRGVIRFEHTPQIPNTRAITFNINANGQENTSAIVMEYHSNQSDLIRQIGQTQVYRWDKNADLYVRDVFGRFLGSLVNRITKLFVQDIDASGNINVSGNITIGDQIVTNGGCLVPHANFWAERAGEITSGGAPAGLQYSFGDGNTDGGPVQPCSGKVVYLSVHAQNANNGNGRIDLVVNNDFNSTCSVATPSQDDGSTQANCSLQFNNRDHLEPRTTTTP
ncbi:MAG: hypothetical protein AABW52_00930, partial [Nanoarchaeota archaeon]